MIFANLPTEPAAAAPVCLKGQRRSITRLREELMRNTTIAAAILSTPLLAQGSPFGAPRAIVGERFFPSAVAAVDVDLDGHRDILASNGLSLDPRGPFETLVMDENFDVRSTRSAPVTGEIGLMAHTAIVTGRFDEDSLRDVFVMSDAGGIALYTNPGPGARPKGLPRFKSPAMLRTLSTMSQRTSGVTRCRFLRVQRVDVDGDGIDEVVQSHHVTSFFDTIKRSGLTLMRHIGDPKKFHEMPIIFGDVRDFASGDFDGDGSVDFAALQGPTQIEIAWNKNGKWGKTTYPSTQPALPTRMAAADIDGDGRKEVLVSGGENPPLVWVHFRNGGTGSRLRRSIGLDEPKDAYVEQIVPIDYDADGDEDLVVLTSDRSNAGRLVILQNSGGGLMRRVATMRTDWDLRQGKHPTHPSGIVVEDLDQDGDLDLLVGGIRDRNKSIVATWVVRNNSKVLRGAKKLVRGSVAATGARADLSFGSQPRLGNRHFGVRLGNVPRGRLAALLLGWRPIRYSRLGLDLVAGPWRSFGTKTRGNGEGGWAELAFDIPRDEVLLDFTFRFQWLYSDPLAANALGLSASAGWSLKLRK